MRVALLLPFALLLGAAQPIQVSNDVALEIYEARATAFCEIGMAQDPADGFEPGTGSRGCQCVVEELMAGKSVAQLPSISMQNFRTVAEDEVDLCRARMKRTEATNVALEPAATEAAEAAEPAAVTDAAPSLQTPPAARSTAGQVAGFAETLTGWMDYLPWLAGGLILLAILVIMIRRLGGDDPRSDLTGVPPSMRSSIKPQPKRPKLPRN